MSKSHQQNIEMAQEAIKDLHDAAKGEFDIHTFSYGGLTVRQCFSLPGEPLDETLMGAIVEEGADSDGNPITLHYDGVLPRAACIRRAKLLEEFVAQGNDVTQQITE